jgi:hypothetical protein
VNELTQEEREELSAHLANEVWRLNHRAERERHPDFKKALIEQADMWRSIIEKLA